VGVVVKETNFWDPSKHCHFLSSVKKNPTFWDPSKNCHFLSSVKKKTLLLGSFKNCHFLSSVKKKTLLLGSFKNCHFLSSVETTDFWYPLKMVTFLRMFVKDAGLLVTQLAWLVPSLEVSGEPWG
jgi:hypothetical protein